MKNRNDFVCPECDKLIKHDADYFVVGANFLGDEFEMKFCESCKPLVFAKLGLPLTKWEN